MDVEAWTTISRLLDEALDLPPAERTAWLERLGAEYASLMPRLRTMLERAAAGGDRFLEALPSLPALGDEVSGLGLGEGEPGALVGPYRLVRELASGGQGSVWLAERTDALVARPVAVKLPIGLAFRPHLAERFAREREILASLTHPHIARLYDAGVARDGTPYFAMEYVEGRPLDRHCDERGLDVEARVGLFVPVIRAVAFAHGRLVIHRDLKPSNVLITEAGDARLLDFGIAKLLDEARPTESTLTLEGGRAMTLRYASPEQVSQAPLGVATDVYSLGVMLFELLTGTSPYRPARDTVAALEEAIVAGDVARPSDVASDPSRRRVLSGDLDTILLKALKTDPAARYATAGDFADDLERYLDGRPVVAQPDRRLYRARKFVARHRMEVAGATAALLAVLIGAGVAGWQARVARVERDAARIQQARAEASSDFLQSLLQQAGPGRALTATELLDMGAARLDATTGVDDGVLAFLRYEISTHYKRFNQTDHELRLLDQSAASARRAGDLDLLAAAECSAAWAIGFRDLPAATARLASGAAALSSLAHPSLEATTDCLRAESRVLEMQGKVEDAIRLLERRLPELPPPDARTWSRIQFLETQLAENYRRVERFADSHRLSEQALDQTRRRGQAGTLDEFSALNNVAGNLNRMGEIQRAHAIYLDLQAWIGRETMPVPPIAMQSNIGFSALRVGDAAEALRLAEAERAVDEKAGNPFAAAVADLLASRALLDLGRIAESRARIDAAEEFWKTNPRGFARMLVEASLQRAELLAAEGNVRPAIADVDSILSSLDYPARANAAGLDRALKLCARLSIAAGDPGRAVATASDALAIARRIARDERASADVGEAALLRAQAYQALGRADEALADARLAAEALGAGLGPDHTTAAAAASLLSALEERRRVQP
jgi:serine/threonine-protein kinase